MLVHWAQLAAVLLASAVPPNFGVPSVNSETSIDSEAATGDHEGGTSQQTRGMTIGSFKGLSRGPTANSNTYSTLSTTKTKGDECVREITIRGRGVQDTFEFPCLTKINRYTSQDDIFLTDVPQINSIFGKQPGKLQVILDDECSVRTYRTVNGKTRASPTPVEGAECDAMKEEHAKRLEQGNQKPKPPTGSGKGPTAASNTYGTWSTTKTMGGQCVREFTIRGRGVEDTFEFPCLTKMARYSPGDSIIFLSSDTPGMNSIYGNQPGELEVIQDGECSVRTYTTVNGKTTASSSPVEGDQCDGMKEDHAYSLNQWKSNRPKPPTADSNPSSNSDQDNYDSAPDPASSDQSTSQDAPASNQFVNDVLDRLKQLMDYIRNAYRAGNV